jgi:hypothetical protein
MLFNFLGAYNNGITYTVNDAVEFLGSCYVMTNFIGAAGYDPVGYPGDWSLVVSKGDAGAAGAQGANGLPCNMRGEWLSAVSYYSGDVVVYSGTLYAVVNDHYSMTGSYEPGIDTVNYIAVPALTGPQGPAGNDGAAGAQGPTGPQGPAGSPAKTVNDVSATVPYTLQLSDNNNIVFTNNSNASTGIIVPADSTLDFPIGATIIIVSSDTYNGIAPETVGWYPTINGSTSGSQVGKTVVTLVKTSANTWYWA